MNHTAPARTGARHDPGLVLGSLAAVVVAIIGLVGLPSASTSATSFRGVLHHGSLGKADGVVPDGVTVFDDGYPAVANLDPDLLAALRRAGRDAERDGVDFVVNSGWRSPPYQEELLDEAVSTYGSEAEAARWVATPSTSPHVAGDAVDLGRAATAWLSAHGSTYGLCQIYRNEDWHFELRPAAVGRSCPPRYADPAHDPRMQQ